MVTLKDRSFRSFFKTLTWLKLHIIGKLTLFSTELHIFVRLMLTSCLTKESYKSACHKHDGADHEYFGSIAQIARATVNLALGSREYVTRRRLAQLRPVPNVVLLPCRTQMKLSFRFKHGSSTPFETIKPGTAELGSARLLSTASLAVPHGSSTTCFQTACYRHAELNS